MRYSPIIFFVVIMLCACHRDIPDRDQLINENLTAMEKEFFDNKDRGCQERALFAAETHLDSVIDQWINTGFMDTLVFPRIPKRPSRPEHIIGTVRKFNLDTMDIE